MKKEEEVRSVSLTLAVFSKGSATLSMAYAGARFAKSALKALDGSPNVEECAFIRTDEVSDVTYFSSRLHLGVSVI